MPTISLDLTAANHPPFLLLALKSCFVFAVFSLILRMATVVAPMYSGHHHTFLHSSSRAATLTTSVSQPQQVQQQEQDVLDDQFTTLFCRALYDYEAQDASALSFRRNDIIEVLTQQPSGWWDGLLGDERGWFPSNYVTVISDEEAELAFSGSEFSNPDGMVAVGDISLRGGAQGENEEWLDNEITLGTGMPGVATVAATGPSQPSDFWMPDVAPDGQVRRWVADALQNTNFSCRSTM